MRQLDAEQERLADAALEDDLLVELAETRARAVLADEEHAVEPAIRESCRRSWRRGLGAVAGGQHVVDPIPGQPRPKIGEVVGNR